MYTVIIAAQYAILTILCHEFVPCTIGILAIFAYNLFYKSKTMYYNYQLIVSRTFQFWRRYNVFISVRKTL